MVTIDEDTVVSIKVYRTMIVEDIIGLLYSIISLKNPSRSVARQKQEATNGLGR